MCAVLSDQHFKGSLISGVINSFLIFSLKDFYCINCSLLHKKKLPRIRWLTVADLSPQFPGQEIHKDKQFSKCQRGGNSPQTQAVSFQVHSLLQNPFACGCNLPVSWLAVTWGRISAPGSHQRCYWQLTAWLMSALQTNSNPSPLPFYFPVKDHPISLARQE